MYYSSFQIYAFLVAGTLNSDQVRDLTLTLKSRFYLQPLPLQKLPRGQKNQSAQDILTVKELIDQALTYLSCELSTNISTKPKVEKKSLKEISNIPFSIVQVPQNKLHSCPINRLCCKDQEIPGAGL